MNRSTKFICLAAGVLISSIPAHDVAARDTSTALTAKPVGFISKSDTRSPGIVESKSDGLVHILCARAMRDIKLACPPRVDGSASSIDDITTAGLRHLRLNIILREMSNIVVSGSGVDSLGSFQEPWADFKITSTAADTSIPAPDEPAYGLPAPPPGDTWQLPAGDHALGLFQGIIENGCVGSPASFDLTLDSSVYRISTEENFGSVHLLDTVEGHGYYNFKYTIRATDEEGNISDFVISGDADSYCTAQDAL